MIYRIYTEDKNRGEVEELVSQHFQAFTIFEAVGYWEGKREKALIIEIQGGIISTWLEVLQVAEGIKAINNQKTVLVVNVKEDGVYYV